MNDFWVLIVATFIIGWHPLGCGLTENWQKPKNIRQWIMFLIIRGPWYIIELVVSYIMNFAVSVIDIAVEKIEEFYKKL